MINQVEAAYEDPDSGEIIATDNAEVEDIYNQVLDASATQSGAPRTVERRLVRRPLERRLRDHALPGLDARRHLGQRRGRHRLGRRRTSSPNGGGNWGGSYLTVPANGAHVEEAQKLADWLTAPEQQIKAFVERGHLPEPERRLQPTRLLTGFVNEYFNNAPVGQIFTDRAKAVTVAPFKGEFYFQVNDAMQKALTRVEDGTQDKQASWDQWVSEVDAIG